MSAGTPRRAVARWAWRMFRREWRQQALVLALLIAAVAASIGLASAAYTTTPVPNNAEYGAANHLIRFGTTDPDALAADVAAAQEWFDAPEVIYHRQVPVPGVFEPIDYRAQDPNGPFGGPRLALLEGTYPAGGQVAITNGAADILDVGIGASVALDGVTRSVVGIVENPGNLADEFVLIPPAQAAEADSVTILVNATDDLAASFRTTSGGGLEIGSRFTNEDVMAAVSVLVLATVGLLLVALIAATSFVVIAQRRMRQLGMLAAIGATEKQLRAVTLTNGIVIGSVAAIVGTVIGLVAWIALAPRVERAVGYRIDELDVPLWLVGTAMLLAIVAGAAAAWWPARTVARVPTVRALSGRPPEPKPVRRAAALALAFAAVGVGCLAVVGNGAEDTSVSSTNGLLIIAGTLAVALSVLLACPLAIRVLAVGVGRLPVAVRLAIGDLARYRARSSAALAAISLALGISVTIIASTTAAQAAADEGNLPDSQMLIRAAHVDGPFIPEAGELNELEAAVDRVAASFDTARVTSLEVALDPDSAPDPSFDGRIAMSLAERYGDGWSDLSLLYVATPDLLALYGYDLDAVAPSTIVLTTETGELAILGNVETDDKSAIKSAIERLSDVDRLAPSYGSLPGTFVTTDVLTDRGWVTAPSGRWLVEMDAPPTAEQLAAAREVAAGAGLTVEVRDRQGGIGALRSGATAVGMLVALGVLSMTVGLVRSEAGRDLRVLTATGATSKTRRTLTAATAGGLAVLGVILGTGGAYLGLTAGFSQDLESLTPVPVAHLAIIALGLPLLASVFGWLVAGRHVADIARQPME